VVLLHGVGLDRTMWDRCLPGLHRTYRVTAVDLRGHGQSALATPGLRLADLAADVLEVIEGLGSRPVHLVGFSLGALVAEFLAATRADRIASLTLVSSVAVRTTEESDAVARRLAAAELDFPATVDAAVERWFDEEWRVRDPELVARVRRTMLGNDVKSYLACYRVFATGDRDVAALLDRIDAPTLAITGSDDPGSTPEMSYRLADAIPDARAEIVAGARHLLPLERPDELVSALIKHMERTVP
jgi:pimeloyl-ACP methyl ester carboxylesterase